MGSAVRNTSFSVFAGQVTGIFGLVGAGRTEMMKIAAGALKRDVFHGGVIRLNGRVVRYRVPQQAVADRIAYITEDRKLDGIFDTMPIAQNIYIGALSKGHSLLSPATVGSALDKAAAWIKSLQIRAINPNARMVELSGGNQQKVVIAKSLVQNPQLVIFDEPTRGVDVGAIAEIHDLVRTLADAGAAVVVISSYLPEILSLSDRILVARQGRIVEEMDPATVTSETILYAAVH